MDLARRHRIGCEEVVSRLRGACNDDAGMLRGGGCRRGEVAARKLNFSTLLSFQTLYCSIQISNRCSVYNSTFLLECIFSIEYNKLVNIPSNECSKFF